MTRNFSKNVSWHIWRRDGGKCIYCGKPASIIDHVVPYSKGGITSSSNGVCSCIGCNMKKKDSINIVYTTIGLVYLSTHGEDTKWVDSLLK